MKKIKLAVLSLLKYLGIFALSRRLTRRGVRILCYHGVWLGDEGFPGDSLFMHPKTFESRLEALRRWRFPVVPLDRAVAGLAGAELPDCPVVITIDDGWYSTYARMLPALRRHGMPATLYCDTGHLLSRRPVPHVMARYLCSLAESGYAGGSAASGLRQTELFSEAVKDEGDTEERLGAVRRLAGKVSIDYETYATGKVFSYMDPEHLREAADSGLDVQLHTHRHRMHDLTPEAVAGEIEENRRHLAQVTGNDTLRFRHFCYPSGVSGPELEAVLDGLGIASSTTTVQAIAYPGARRQFLPRILDGEQLTPLELEAELCGVMDILRGAGRCVAGDRELAGGKCG